MTRRMSRSFSARSSQQGATLVVVLILLLLMTLLGLASLRGTVLEERMTANLLDRGMAFQVAEAALREAETRFDPPPTFPGSGCAAGLCAMPVAGATDRWVDTSFAGWQTAAVVDNSMNPPQYFVETLGLGLNWPKCDSLPENKRSPQCETPRYRVTSRSVQDGRASVILQTMYAGK